MSRAELRRLQRWFAFLVEHPATAEVAMSSRTAKALMPPSGEGGLLAPNAHCAATVGLDVYNTGYLLRLVEVMQGDFGAVQHVIGEQAFRDLVARYVAAHPSRHPNLNQLGVLFPAFLRRQRRLAPRGFLAELATLERSLCDAFDAPEFTSLANDALAQVPQDQWPRVRFVANPSVQLLRCRYPIDLFYQAWKEGKPIDVPDEGRSWLLVFRRNDRVWRQRLTRSSFAVLSALVAGRPLGQALAMAKEGEPVTEWFQDFAREGLFVGWRVAGRAATGPATAAR